MNAIVDEILFTYKSKHEMNNNKWKKNVSYEIIENLR